jgi:transposase
VERAEAEAVYEQGRDAVVAVFVALSERIAAQDAQIAKLTARMEELERRLSRSSRNSSLPPSQDPPGAAKRKGPQSDRGPGGQPGHPGHGRRFQPLERVDEIVEHWPDRCGCGRVIRETERVAAGEPARHQVAELPPVTVIVTEHRLHRVCCPGCGRVAGARLPAGIPVGAFGARLEAAVATLAVRNRVSRRDLVELLGELFGCQVSTGTVDAIVHRTGEALAGPYAALQSQIRAAAAVNVDETGWRLRGGRRTLWGAFNARHALLRVAPDRHQRELDALLGEEFSGIACSDRWWAYNRFAPDKRQLCWSHLLRDFTAHAEGMAAQKELGQAGLRIADQLFAAWKIYKQDGDRRALKRRVAPLKRELRALLETNATKRARNRYTRTISNNLLKLWPALWTFIELDGVEPTNNHAERGLRGAVIHRKLSLGSQSDQGERTIERLLSASITCRLQKRSLFTYLTQVISANARGDPMPALA